MKKKILTLVLLVCAFATVQAQSSGRIYQPGSDGPYYEYSIEQGRPKEYYDAGGPDNGMRGNMVYTMLRLKPLNSDSHITIVIDDIDIDPYDELRVYDGLIVLNNEPNEDGEYEYGWPKNITPNTTIKGNPASKPVVITSKSPDGAVSVAFYCFSNKPGWSGMIHCVKNGDPEPNGNTVEEAPNFSFRIDPNIVLEKDEDGEEEELFVNLELKGIEENQVIHIEDGYGKREYTLGNKVASAVSLDVSPGETVKIYGELSTLNASNNQFVSAALGKNDHLEVLNLSRNKITAVDLTKLPKLRELWLTDNRLTSIDISNLPELEEFYGSYNKVGELRTSMNPKLDVLTCVAMGLTELDLTQNPKLLILTASDNAFTSLPDFTSTPSLRWLDLENTGISCIDVSMLPQLKTLDLSGNKLAALDLSNNPLVASVDLDKNLFDACSINDLLYTLPKRTADDNAALRMDKNEGAAACDNTLIEGKNWTTNFTGDGTGCETVRLRFEPSESGSISTTVDGARVAEWTPIKKGKEVKVEASPINGYKLDKILLDGAEVADNTFKIAQYGVLAAIFVSTSGIDKVETSALSIVRNGENVVVSGLVAGGSYQIYDLSGKLLHNGCADADGAAVIALPVNKVIIVRQGNIAIKIMR